jgi:hypothetical protein
LRTGDANLGTNQNTWASCVIADIDAFKGDPLADPTMAGCGVATGKHSDGIKW